MSKNILVLILLQYYLPGWKTGGPVRSTANLIEHLGDDFDFRLLCADRDKGDTQPYPGIPVRQWLPVGKAQVQYLPPDDFSFHSLRHVLNTTPYDILYLNSVLASMIIKVLILRRLGQLPNRSVIVSPRGHLDTGALSLKSRKKYMFLNAARISGLFDNVYWHASSPQEAENIVTHFGEKHRPQTTIIPNLPVPAVVADGDQPTKSAGLLKLVFLSRIARKKGLDHILRALITVKGTITFSVYGPIEDAAYWDECQSLINRLPSTITVQYQGTASPDTVVDTLSQYHLFVLPTLGENYGHVIAEALIAGCPILISDRTPWNNVEAAGAGWVIPLNQPNRWTESLHTAIALRQDEFNMMSASARSFAAQHVDQEQNIEATKTMFMQQVNH